MTVFDLVSQFARYVHRINDQDISQMCGLTIGTTTSKIKTTTSIYYNLYNKNYTLAVTDNITLTTCAQQAISTFCYYLISVDVSGNVTTTKGTDNTYALPTTPAGTVPIGALKITTNASATFTAGTTALTASGVTAVYYDIDCGMALSLINQAQKRLERGVTITKDGKQRTIMDFKHMLVRTTATIHQGDTTVTMPFPNYKDFVDDSLTITDSIGVVYPMIKDDVIPRGDTSIQNRPYRISRLPEIELTFTKDGAPTIDFTIWPESDATYSIDVTAYQYSPTLDGVIYTSNWLTENASDVLLFGGLVECASYFPEDPRIPEWKSRWEDAVFTLMASQEKEKFSGSMISTKFFNPLRANDNLGLSSSMAGILSYGYLNRGE